MSNYTGPGIYMIIPMHSKEMCLDIWCGSTDPGTPVKLYNNGNSGGLNQTFEIVAAGGKGGNPEVGDREYHILGVNSGLMLCAPDNGSTEVCVMASRPVKNLSTRWTLVPLENGAFNIINAHASNAALSVRGGGRGSGTDLMIAPRSAGVLYQQFELKRPTV
ncbi:hypothetical protein FRB94_004677 [Tulasnella sp. JGI-2019a]|nr:hypothetical protein FRB94_004677 [Tulasnella sp. JGI-2019a]KAG9006345.1 hypothetical protein FRB93_008834 [Tulasnella sp. JGI-2019a]